MNGVHFFGFDCGFGVWMVLFLDLGLYSLYSFILKLHKKIYKHLFFCL
ncbi:hypothetical protein BSPCLSOX_520 [uncultured Gammaproteobacteria bacterium]|nr:hypothetical protein BSPCLSOX_520 [uncultured Gammaproteobacteria bacterium]